MSDTKFEIKVDVPAATYHATSYLVKCGKCEMLIIEQRKDHKYTGLWLPEFDWREMYVLEDEKRRGFALPFRTMLRLTKEHLVRCETRRQIKSGASQVDLD